MIGPAIKGLSGLLMKHAKTKGPTTSLFASSPFQQIISLAPTSTRKSSIGEGPTQHITCAISNVATQHPLHKMTDFQDATVYGSIESIGLLLARETCKESSGDCCHIYSIHYTVLGRKTSLGKFLRQNTCDNALQSLKNLKILIETLFCLNTLWSA